MTRTLSLAAVLLATHAETSTYGHEKFEAIGGFLAYSCVSFDSALAFPQNARASPKWLFIVGICLMLLGIFVREWAVTTLRGLFLFTVGARATRFTAFLLANSDRARAVSHFPSLHLVMTLPLCLLFFL